MWENIKHSTLKDMAAREPAGNSHLKASEPNTENLPPAQPETRPEQGHPLQETLASDLGHDSLVVHHSGLPEDVHAASVRVCEVMDKIGYNEAMVRHRQENYKKSGIITITGSKGEGFSTPYESDTDCFCLMNEILCREHGYASLQRRDINAVFIMDGEHCHPGHFWLKLDHLGAEGRTVIKDALFVHTNGQKYLSSHTFTEEGKNMTHGKVSGPALTLTHQSINTDTVIALPIQQQMLSEWISRPRHHSWPSPELKQEISKLGAYLVPVGCKGSETKHMEWRVGFIGEQKLTDSFTECQYKLYNVLKFLMKTELKPICDEMSSYIVKNIVFWFIELTQQELFSKENMLNISFLVCKSYKKQSGMIVFLTS
ncbi:uncharacterized protein LOC128223669 isoform X2 [Mya arenaria]|uniref:uncharacterized protein LOC128223669 isoform X2 n=1 Tax=Mya arenaria TaxID=6604 RepID=UPI0022DF6D1B|nr:uncharacterized protein LOC128223669 isoform X2 [Mya arenaria]